MSGAIHSLPQYAFMAWCSVKAQGQLYLYLYPLQLEVVPSNRNLRTGHDMVTREGLNEVFYFTLQGAEFFMRS
jgi:hypothetical protein